jgi:hypothetical protein
MAGDIKPDLGQSLQLELLQQMGGLSQQIGVVQGQNNIIIKEQERAAAGRAAMHEKLNKIDALSQTVDRIAPLVQKHEDRHNQAIGAMWAGRAIWGISAGAIGAAITLLINKLGFGPPH